MSTKHTPGPWIHETGPDAPIGSVVDKLGETIAQAQENCHCGRSEDAGRAMQQMRNANARLIAAAPEMLEALEAMVALSDDPADAGFGDFMMRDLAAQKLARAAIAKAKGAP